MQVRFVQCGCFHHPHRSLFGDPEPPVSSSHRNPRPKSPCVGDQRRAGLGQALPVGSPIVVSRVQKILRSTYIRGGRRAPCRDRRHQRHREGANLVQFCHLRDCVSAITPRDLRSVVRVGRFQCAKKRICTQSSASKINMVCGHLGFSVLVMSESSQ